MAIQSRNTPAAGSAVRSRTAPGNRSATPAGQSGGGWMKSGTAARQTSEAELARQREAAERRAAGLYMPFRFWVPVGGQTEIVVLDAEPGPCFYEHMLQNPQTGKWDVHETCPREWEPCPLCDKFKDSYYVMMLSVVELRPYTNRQGVEVPYSRKLLPVKAQQQGFFLRQFDRHGTLRGMHLLMSRDTNQTASIGVPEFIELHSEEDIIASFGHDAVKAQDGRELKPANADCFPFAYDKLFTKPSAEDLRKRYGGAAPAGSRQEQADEWGESNSQASGNIDNMPMDDGADDDIPL